LRRKAIGKKGIKKIWKAATYVVPLYDK